MAERVVRPPSNGQHIHHEKLTMQGQPREKLALGLGVGMPDFLRTKSWVASEELDVISRTSGVCAVISRSLANGVRLVGNQLQRGNDVPNFQGKLNRCAEPSNGADRSLLCDRAFLPCG
jgi:hypothetical protein